MPSFVKTGQMVQKLTLENTRIAWRNILAIKTVKQVN
jgi:hypothetical protein